MIDELIILDNYDKWVYRCGDLTYIDNDDREVASTLFEELVEEELTAKHIQDADRIYFCGYFS
jgi:hypothetical protein